MSIETEITRLQSAKANIKSAIETKLGSSIPLSVSISNYPTYVSSAAVRQYNLGSAAGAASGGGGGGGGGDAVVLGGGKVTQFNSSSTTYGAVDLQYASISNITIEGKTSMTLRSSSFASGIVVSSCYSSAGGGLNMGPISGGLGLQAGTSAVDITILANGQMTMSGGTGSNATTASNIVVSSGGYLYVSSATAELIQSKAGANVYVCFYSGGGMAMDASSATVTDDYSSNGSVLTFKTAPRVQVDYAGAGDKVVVAGITTPADANGTYEMYNGDPTQYKHVFSNYYIFSNSYYSYYMLASTIISGYPSGQYFNNYTGITTGTWTAVSSGAGSMTATASSITGVGAWQYSGANTWNGYGSAVFTGDAEGSLPSATLVFSSATGYVTPSNVTLTSLPDKKTTVEISYLIAYTVTITGVSGGQWSYDGGTTWVNSGSSANIPAKKYVNITFNIVQSGGNYYTHDAIKVFAEAGSTSTSVAFEQASGYYASGCSN